MNQFTVVDYFNTGLLFVTLTWLILVKGGKDFVPSLEVCGTCDLLDAFPQPVVNSSTILHSTGIIYTLTSLCISSTPKLSCYFSIL